MLTLCGAVQKGSFMFNALDARETIRGKAALTTFSKFVERTAPALTLSGRLQTHNDSSALSHA